MSILYIHLLSHAAINELEPWHWLVHTVEIIEAQLSAINRCIMRLVNKDSSKKRPNHLPASRHGPEIVAFFDPKELRCGEECTSLFGRFDKIDKTSRLKLMQYALEHVNLVMIEWMTESDEEYWKPLTHSHSRDVFSVQLKCVREGKTQLLQKISPGIIPEFYLVTFENLVGGKTPFGEKVEYILDAMNILERDKCTTKRAIMLQWHKLIEYGTTELIEELIERGNGKWKDTEQLRRSVLHYKEAIVPTTLPMYKWMKQNKIPILQFDMVLGEAISTGDQEFILALIVDSPKCAGEVIENGIFAAIMQNQSDLVRWLIDQKCIIGEGCFQIAVQYGRYSILEMLIESYPECIVTLKC